MFRLAVRPFLTVSALLASFLVALVVRGPAADAGPGPGTTPLTAGSLTMISTHADGSSGMPSNGVEGANQVAINDDGSAVAFVSDVPAQDLVTDPVELARGVTDNNTGSGGPNSGDDVFVYEKLPGPVNPIISLVSENETGTGTGDAPSYDPVMAPHGLGMVFQSSATDMVSGHVDASQNHIYAWVPALSSLTGVFLMDTKYNSSDACNCAATDPSISLFPPTVVFEATGGGSNDLVAPGVKDQGENQIYAHDIVSNTNTLVSATNDSHIPNDRSATDPDVGNGAIGGASEPMIASDAPIVVFTATGDDLVDNFENSNGSNIWEHNLLTGKTTLVSVSASGDPNGTTGNHNPVISNFGTSVAWSSNDPDVSSTPFFNAQQTTDHLFAQLVLPVQSPTVMVDTDKTGAIGCDENSNDVGISGDGLSVVFQSNCDDISTVPDNNGSADVFERKFAPIPDVAPKLLSINDAGTATGNGESDVCAPDDGNFNAPCDDHENPNVGINFDGTVVTYFTDASDVAGPAQGTPPFNDGSVIVSYPKILGGVKNVLASARTDGAYADDTSGDAVVSKDGSSVAFVSAADNLVQNDNNGYFDVFESDLHNQFYFQPITPVDEGAGEVTIGVVRTGNNGTDDSVEVKTGDGFDTSISPDPFPDATEAHAPGDYTAVDQTLDFPPGAAVETFQVPIIDDNLVEGPEVFHVSMSPSSSAGAGLPGPASDAYVEILDNDAPPQDWSAAVTGEPDANAPVGSTVTVKTTISVDAGADDLTVNSLSSGAATSGLTDVQFDQSTFPFTVQAGTTKDVTATATVAAAPGTAGIQLETSIDGTLGAAETVKSADSNTITSTEAVSAQLSGVSGSVGLGDQITYKLTLTDNSDTAAQVDVPAAGFAAPTGTSFVSRTDGATALSPGASTEYDLTVKVDNADPDGTVLTEAPTNVTYAMSDIGLAARPVLATDLTTSVHAPVVAVGTHTITDDNGGSLEVGDTVDVSVTVANTGAADTSGTLVDTFANLQNPTSIKLDGSSCGACTSSSTKVTAPFGTLSAGGTHVLTYSAKVKNVAAGSIVSSSSVVTFAPATTGTSPTSADVQTLTVGSNNAQDWSVTIAAQPPASAAVGDTVTVKAKISVTSGPDSLDVTNLSSGANTSGLDQVAFGDTPPFSISAGDSRTVTATALVTAAPGTGGVELEVSVDAALGAAASTTKTADSHTIASTEAVTATLTGGPPTVTTADFITYTVHLTNTSDTAAQLTGLPAALTAPVGTGLSVSPSGSDTVPANGSTDWTMTVGVDHADTDGQALTETPGAISYAMSDISLPARAVAVTPPSVTSTVSVPDNTKPSVTINQANGQADPTATAPIKFTVVFSEPVTGFDESDVKLQASTVGGILSPVVTGGPTTYTVSVSGMTTPGDVIATIPAGAAIDASSNPSNASTSTDNSITWLQAIGTDVTMKLSPSSAVYGQTVHATATVGVDSGTPDGAVQFDVDGVDVGSPVTVNGSGKATSPALTGSGGVPLAPGSRVVTGTFTPSDPLSYAGSAGSTTLAVDKAATATAVTVTRHALTATVAAVGPGAGEPGGHVTFSVDGQSVGTAPVSSGAATLSFTTPAGKTRQVGAHYGGDAHFTASSASTARHDPTITAHVSSAHKRTSYGWYRSSVKVSFTCATHGAPLVSSCPHSVVLGKNGAAQSVSRTITATDGGMATASTLGINIDHTAPSVTVSGVTDGGKYSSPGPSPHCVGHDPLSGVATCHLHTSTSVHGSTTTVQYSAVATDKAGNSSSVSGHYELTGITLQGVPFHHGAYTVHRKHTYLLVVHSATRPTYYDAAPYPQQPFHPDAFRFHSAGHNQWALDVTMTSSLHSHRYWNIGVLIGATMHVFKIRVLAP